MENELLFLSFVAVTLIRLQKKRNKPRKMWVKKWLLKRHQYSHVNILKELRFHPKDWHNYMRMTEPTYLKLLKLVSPKIQKHDTNMRQAVSNHERLSATLRFLATGRSYEDLKFSSIISPQLLGRIIPETCAAIYKACHDYCKTTSKHQRDMPRISPDNPVRRRLTFGEDVEDQSKVDNFANVLQESIAKDREEKSKKWNFDFLNEEPMNGPYKWYKKDGDNWIGMKHRKSDVSINSDDDKISGIQYNNENTPVHVRDDSVPALREKGNNVKGRIIRQSVKRKVDFDCAAYRCRRQRL